MGTGRYNNADLDDTVLDGIVGGSNPGATKKIPPEMNASIADLAPNLVISQIVNSVSGALANAAAGMDEKGKGAILDAKAAKSAQDEVGKPPATDDARPAAKPSPASVDVGAKTSSQDPDKAGKAEDFAKNKSDELDKLKSNLDAQYKSNPGMPKDFLDKIKASITAVDKYIDTMGKKPDDVDKSASKVSAALKDLSGAMPAMSAPAESGKTGQNAPSEKDVAQAMASMGAQVASFVKSL